MRSFVQYIVEEDDSREVYQPGEWRKRTPEELEIIVDTLRQNRDHSFGDVLVASGIIPKPVPEGWDPQLWYQLQIWGIFDRTVDNTPEEEPEEVEPTPIEDGGSPGDQGPLRYFRGADGTFHFTNQPTQDPNDPLNQPPAEM